MITVRHCIALHSTIALNTVPQGLFSPTFSPQHEVACRTHCSGPFLSFLGQSLDLHRVHQSSPAAGKFVGCNLVVKTSKGKVYLYTFAFDLIQRTLCSFTHDSDMTTLALMPYLLTGKLVCTPQASEIDMAVRHASGKETHCTQITAHNHVLLQITSKLLYT